MASTRKVRLGFMNELNELIALLDTSGVPSHFTIALTKKEADAIAALLKSRYS